MDCELGSSHLIDDLGMIEAVPCSGDGIRTRFGLAVPRSTPSLEAPSKHTKIMPKGVANTTALYPLNLPVPDETSIDCGHRV
jgi:hypothetical protein